MIYPYFNYYSGPLQLTEFYNKLYFSADDGSGRKLWMSDGTFEGTSYAPNNNPVTLQGNSYDYFSPHPFTIVGKALYFWAYTSVTGWELYKYAPSIVANIELVKNISPGTESTQFNYYEMTNVNDTLFFKITNPDGGNAIWMSKGKAGNTEKVMSFAPGEYLYGLFNGYGTLYFIKGGATYGYELWKTDGTEAGTVIVKDINAGSASSNPYSLTAFNNKIIFSATQGNHGYELWITDGSESGTTEVKDINKTTTDNFNPYNITAYTHGVMFTAYTAKHGTRLYKSDGTDAGTKLLNDSITSDNTTYFYNFSSKGDKVYFEGINAAGYAIYETNGTNNDTKRVTRFDSNYIYKYSIADNGTVFYAIYNSFTGVYELWANDGLGGQNIFLTNTLYYSDYLITVGNTAYFVAGDFTTGYELWKSDGTVAGTGLVKDIYPGDYGSYPSNLYNFNGKLYFAADYGLGPFIWTSDGTDAGTKVVKAMYMNSPFAQANGKLFFCGYNIIGKGYELYATDGTGAGTKLVKDIFRGPLSSIPYSLVSGDTLLYFMANDGKHGYELWTSNGTKDGTHLVKNITSGIGDSYFYPMVNVKDNLFFMSSISDTSSPGGLSNILWQSDGTKPERKK
jgi:ELWxxDGT repeat protein